MKIAANGAWLGTEGLRHCHDERLCAELVQFFRGQTVADFGCGLGLYARAIGADGFDGNPDTPTLAPGCRVLDLSEPQHEGSWDWVLSLEVGEHIPQACAEVFLDNLTRHASTGIVLSWAVPGQAGDGHVNCRPNGWVRREMNARGFVSTLENEPLRRAATLPWFRETLMVFRRLEL